MLLVALAAASLAAGSGACEVPTAPIAQEDAPDAAACEARCAAHAGCGAWTFVSGWDRCKLHAPTTRRVTLHLVSAVAETAPDGARALGPPRRDHDNAARDLEPAPRDLPSAEACAAACVETAACRGYVYVEGYRACWLKQAVGALTPKTFTCGTAGGAAAPAAPAAPPAPGP